MALPVLAGSEVQTPVSGVKINRGAFREAALAPSRVAAQIDRDVGGFFSDVSRQIQDNRNADTVFKADLAMRKTKDDFTAQLATMPDERTWLPAYKSQVEQVRTQHLNDVNVGPSVKRELSKKFDMWEQATTSEIRTAALLKGVKRTRDDGIATATYAATQGDLEGANNALRAIVEAGSMTPEEAHKIGGRFPNIAAQAKASLAIDLDPIRGPEILEDFKADMEPLTYARMKKTANEARNQARRNNNNEWNQAFANTDGIIDVEALKADVKSGEITQQFADGLIARMEGTKIKQSKADLAIALSEIQDHDWDEDRNPEETATKISDAYAHLQQPDINRLSRSLESRLEAAKKKGESEQRPVERQIFEQMRENRERNGYTIPMTVEEVPAENNFFGPDKPATVKYGMLPGGLSVLRDEEKFPQEKIEQYFGKGVTREQVIRAEQLHYAQIQEKMREWFKDPSNKDAPYEKAYEHLKSLEKPYVMSAVSASLKPSEKAMFKPGQKVRQKGVVYTFDGTSWVADK